MDEWRHECKDWTIGYLDNVMTDDSADEKKEKLMDKQIDEWAIELKVG